MKLNDATDLKIGTTDIQKVMVGNVQVWARGGAPAPDDEVDSYGSYVYLDITYSAKKGTEIDYSFLSSNIFCNVVTSTAYIPRFNEVILKTGNEEMDRTRDQSDFSVTTDSGTCKWYKPISDLSYYAPSDPAGTLRYFTVSVRLFVYPLIVSDDNGPIVLPGGGHVRCYFGYPRAIAICMRQSADRTERYVSDIKIHSVSVKVTGRSEGKPVLAEPLPVNLYFGMSDKPYGVAGDGSTLLPVEMLSNPVIDFSESDVTLGTVYYGSTPHPAQDA